ncbi:MAG: hypothetical protein C4329_04685 [Chitinophagaceae bacterium]
MKHFFTLLLIFSGSLAFGQFSAGMHTGASDRFTVAGIHSQYQFKNRFAAGVNLTAHLNNSDPVFFQSRFGYTIGNYQSGLSVQPYTGYSYNVQNVEQKKHGGNITYGAQVRWQIGMIGLLYADVNKPSNEHIVYSIGLAGVIPRKQ